MAQLYRSNHQGAVSSIISEDLPTNKVVVSDESGKVSSADITTDELNALSGVSENIQNQIDNHTHDYTKASVSGTLLTLE